MDLATLSAAPTLLDVGGKTFKVGPLRYLELGILQRIINEKRPDGSVKVGDMEWVDVLSEDVETIGKFIQVMFAKHQTLTDDDLDLILGEVGPRQVSALWNIALELPPLAGIDGGNPDPKAGTAPSTS